MKEPKKNVIVFPVIDWDFRIQRPQHFSRGLAAEGNNVIYLTTTFNHKDIPGFKIVDKISEGLIICQLNLNVSNKNIYNDSLSHDEVIFLLKSLSALRCYLNFRHSYSIVNLPFWSDLVYALQANTVIYDCMDHHAGLENNNSQMLNKEDQLLSKADLVITTAGNLSHKIAAKIENIIIRNAAEVESFSKKTGNPVSKGKKKVVGYYGAIAEWLDLDLLCFLARNTPDLEYHIIGNVTIDISAAKKFDNVSFFGEVPYTELTNYLHSFDICIIPFKLIELTLCTNPVKVYEYLAAGKPVVSTAMPEVIDMSDYVHIGYSYEKFLEKISIALNEIEDIPLENKRKQWALQHDWSSRARMLIAAVDNLVLYEKKVSLIVLTFNNLALTKKCLYSIVTNTSYLNYEVIVVDNASTDGTQNYLNEEYGEDSRFKIIFNEDNLGFAAGNNVGLEQATGDILVIINNDTYVAPFWLEPIVSTLENNDEIFLVCPVTNNIGNEEKINISYNSFSEMTVQSLKYSCEHYGDIYPVECVAFFCAAMTRDTYNQAGAISEDYGLGFYEDDDYCMKVKSLGLSNFVVEQSFVHHHLSASFNELKNNQKEVLMRKNRAIFESKWGEWQPHKYRDGVQ
ncbi:MAG: Putative teichuronic acid biosynthesis glycosyltransferase TuaH [Candidatus Erwinia impunctatus]|nr:Putative teichuronic acid biosynthesis glycosyltransferase TuaH [Culicoides impunctatus]